MLLAGGVRTNNNCSGGSLGTSISTPGSYFSINGVPPGTYTLQAFMDNQGHGTPNASNPTGSVSSVVVTDASYITNTIVLADPAAATTLTTAPTLFSASGFNTGVLVEYKPILNGSNVEQATSYTLQWSATSSPFTVLGSKTLPAIGTNNDLWFVNGLANGSTYYFRAYGTSVGTATGPTSAVYGPVTVGTPAPTGGNVVTGAVSFSATDKGPLYVGFLNRGTGAYYGEYFASPVSAQAYSIQVPAGNYLFLGVLDQNNDGVIDAGDLQNVTRNSTVSAITGNTSNKNLTLSNAHVTTTVTTEAISTGGSSNSYVLNFYVNGLVKQPVAVELSSSSNSSGANVVTPTDIALCTGSNGCSQGFQISIGLGSTSPTVGDSYIFEITYSDGTTGTVTATVTAVLSSFATSLVPTTGTSTSLTPVFSWTDPANASNYTYWYSICCSSTGGSIWQIPGSNAGGFSSSITSIPTWGTDPTGSGSTPTAGLSNGTTYQWQILVEDSNGNSAVTQVIYQP